MQFFPEISVITDSLGVLGLILLVIGILYIIRPYSKEKIGKRSYGLKSSVFTQTELKFYQSLCNYFIENKLAGSFTIFSKMRIIDVIYPAKQFNGQDNKKYLYKILSKHFDFIITNKVGRPILIIELDDRYHKGRKYYKADELKNEICKNVGIPLIRYMASNNYSFANLDEYLIK